MNSIGRKNLFITGIDTGVGKTVVAAILAQALGADYWKPVQCGELEASDRQSVAQLVDASRVVCHPEAVRLAHPRSPHQAAAWEGRKIELAALTLPVTARRLVVEGAGGVLVPLNADEWIVDIAVKFDLAVVVVTRNYLGSLNHTFLTVEALRLRGLTVAGLVFNGPADSELEEFVTQRTKLPILLRLNHEEQLDEQTIARYAAALLEEGILNDGLVNAG